MPKPGVFVQPKLLSLVVNVWQKDLLHIVNHSGFIAPVVLRKVQVPIAREIDCGKASSSFSLIDKLTGKKSALMIPVKTAVICHLSLSPVTLTRFDPSLAMLHSDTGT